MPRTWPSAETSAARRRAAISPGVFTSRISCRYEQRVLDGARRALALAAQVLDLAHGANHVAVHRLVDAQRVDEPGAPLEQLGQPLVELVDRERRVAAEVLLGAFDAHAPAVPDLALAIPLAHEHHERVLGVSRQDQRRRLGLLEAGQVPEVAAGPVVVVGVVAAVAHRRGDHERSRRSRRCAPSAARGAPRGRCGPPGARSSERRARWLRSRSGSAWATG